MKIEKIVKALVMDVDGTLTDGKIHICSNGELFKSFSVNDGYGIHTLLPQFNIVPIIITGRISKIVEQRAKELEITHFYQGINNKSDCLREVISHIGITFEQTACIGDDLNDISMIKLCGVKGCPANAVKEVREVCDYICKTSGGHGAVREFIEWLIYKDGD